MLLSDMMQIAQIYSSFETELYIAKTLISKDQNILTGRNEKKGLTEFSSPFSSNATESSKKTLL